MNQRNKPSSKARTHSYMKIGALCNLLSKLNIKQNFLDFEGTEDIDYDGWKRWVITHVPADKRGGFK